MFFSPPSGIPLVLATHPVNLKPQSIASRTRISWGYRPGALTDGIRHLSPDNWDSPAREISKSEVKKGGRSELRSDAFGLDIS